MKTAGGFAAEYTWVGSRGVARDKGRSEERGDTGRGCYGALVGVAVELALFFSSLEMDYGTKYAARKHASACTASPDPTPAACPDSRFAVWPSRWPLPPLERPKPDPPQPLEHWPSAVRLGASVWPELVVSGWGSVGLSAEVGGRFRFVSATLEAHADPPLGPVAVPGVGEVSFTRVSGAMLLCAHFRWLAACGLGDVGRYLFPNHVPTLPPSAFYGAAGARAGLEFPVAPPRVFVRVAGDLRTPIRPQSYTRNGVPFFQSAGLGGGLGLGVLAELPP
jgi:hypothetical protein